ncbi:MAG: type VI secretion system baseplate subunit TssG [Prevotellaceae bacterium]|jgi:hypothetical protein|nr:type VI secretion system baseplate subunit TssG [Prevotellaceae bacterium]
MDNSFTVNTVETDYRSEVAAACLIENEQVAGRVLIVRSKGNWKEISKDIDNIKSVSADEEYSDLINYLYIYANRESIYDSLPEGIFHQSSDHLQLRSKDDIINDIRIHKNRESDIRRFFHPFEIVLDKIGIEAQLCERKYHKIHLYENLPNVLKNRWHILQYLSTRQVLLFIKLIPVISEISRSLEQIAQLISIILNCSVCIREGKKTVSHLDTEDRTPLGKWQLGIRSVLGKTVANDSVDIEITVEPVSPAQMRTFEHNAINDRILKELIDMTIPFERHVSIKYKISKAEAKFRLSGKSHKAWLGINTTLEN